MEQAIQYIKTQNIQDYIQIIKILMETAEKQSGDGTTKLELVMTAWKNISASPSYKNITAGVSLDTVHAVIEAIILATKTSIAVNKTTGCWSAFKNLFKKKTTAV